MPELQLLRADHAEALRTFETANREFFAQWIPDRGEAYFEEFEARHAALLQEQESGGIRMHLLVEDDGSVLGRFNLVDILNGNADLGYRMAQHAGGRGLATAAVKQLLELAMDRYELRTVHAETTVANLASQRVLLRNGFVELGEIELSGAPGRRYRRDLA